MAKSASTLFLAASLSSAVGTAASIQSQRAALARESYRAETESKLAAVRALEEENARKEELNTSIANNLAWQSISGYSDDSRSFLNIQSQVRKKAEKDISNIRLMGKTTALKYQQMQLENKYKERELVFGGYTSVLTELYTGYGNYKYYDKKGEVN
jgi:DNA-directed RNA polymerase specialized sigma subunit